MIPKGNTGITLNRSVLDQGRARARAVGVSFSQYVEGIISKDNERELLHREIVTASRRLQYLRETLEAIEEKRREHIELKAGGHS
jgi:hypothetical protein